MRPGASMATAMPKVSASWHLLMLLHGEKCKTSHSHSSIIKLLNFTVITTAHFIPNSYLLTCAIDLQL